MNERIRQLAEQAGLKIEYQMINPPKPFQILGSTEQFEKFAELIVKKCMDVAKYHTPDTEECEYTWLIHDKIKKYFGVEE
jgi:hypothetical protein